MNRTVFLLVFLCSISVAVAAPQLPLIFDADYPTQPVSGTIRTPMTATEFQTALNQAQPGDTIVLQAGTTYAKSGGFVLPPKTQPDPNNPKWIVITSSNAHLLPPPGNRVQPNDAVNMPRIEVLGGGQNAFSTGKGASYYRLVGLEVAVVPSVTSIVYDVIMLDYRAGGSSSSNPADHPRYITLDRMYIHGDTNTMTTRCVTLNGEYLAVLDSYFEECHLHGFDSQAIGAWNGAGPFKIINNYLEGVGENVMFGGGDPSIQGLVPSDIEFRRNYLYTPPSWKYPAPYTSCSAARSADPNTVCWMKKMVFETKNARRLLMEGNIFDGSWSDGQVGFAIWLKSANQGGQCPWCVSQDITIRNNIIRNAAAGLAVTGIDGTGTAIPQHDVLVENNIFENIGVDPYTGAQQIFYVTSNPKNVTITKNSVTSWNAIKNTISIGQAAGAATNLEISDNIFPKGLYPIVAPSRTGEAILVGPNPAVVGTSIYNGNVMIGSSEPSYPLTTFVPTITAARATGKGANEAAVSAATANTETGIWGSCTPTTWTPNPSNLCGTVTQTSNCYTTRTVQGGITCSGGQSCVNNQCIAPAVCGNSIVEQGEQCDTGNARGTCPAACSTSCQQNNCPGKIASYQFNEASGTSASDDSGQGRTATLTGSTWTSGRNAGAIQLSGSNSYGTVNDFPPPSSITLQAWIYPTTVLGDDRMVFTKGNQEYEMRIAGATTRLQAGFSGAVLRDYTTDFSQPSTLNTWHHYAYTYDATNGNARLYKNGVLVNSSNAPGLSPADTLNGLIIGKSQSTWGNFIGKIDDVSIWNVARTQAEIQADMNGGGSPPVCTPENDATFCSRLSATCGSKTGVDNCGTTRTVSNCGTCQSGYTCTNNACVQNPTHVPQDRNGDGTINVQDIIIVIGDIKTQNLAGDVNNDGIVDIRDIVLIAKAI